MKRREFLTAGVAGAGAAAAATFATPAIAQDKRQWNMVTAWPKNLPGPGVAAQKLADRITTLSGGRLEVKLHAAGELVPGDPAARGAGARAVAGRDRDRRTQAGAAGA